MSILNPTLLSIVARTRGSEEFERLKEALNSIANSDYRPIEVLVVSKNTNKEFKQRLENFLSQLCGAALIFKHLNFEDDPIKDTRSKSLNVGIENAAGQFLAFLDYDDLIGPKTYSKLLKQIQGSGSALAAIGTEVHVHPKDGRPPEVLKAFSWASKLSDLYQENFLPIQSFVLNRAIIHSSDLKFNKEMDLYEDYEFLLRLSSKYDFDFSLLSEFGAIYRVFEGSHTNPSLTGLDNPETIKRHERNDQIIRKLKQQLPAKLSIAEVEALLPKRAKGHPLKRYMQPLFKAAPELEKLISKGARFVGIKPRRF